MIQTDAVRHYVGGMGILQVKPGERRVHCAISSELRMQGVQLGAGFQPVTDPSGTMHLVLSGAVATMSDNTAGILDDNKTAVRSLCVGHGLRIEDTDAQQHGLEISDADSVPFAAVCMGIADVVAASGGARIVHDARLVRLQAERAEIYYHFPYATPTMTANIGLRLHIVGDNSRGSGAAVETDLQIRLPGGAVHDAKLTIPADLRPEQQSRVCKLAPFRATLGPDPIFAIVVHGVDALRGVVSVEVDLFDPAV